jgi:hypothetical protein
VVGIVVLAIAAISARSMALAGFGLDSLIEIGRGVPAGRPSGTPGISSMSLKPAVQCHARAVIPSLEGQ